MERGSLALTLRAAWQTIVVVSAPTLAEAFLGRLTPEACDARLADWASWLVEKTQTKLHISGHEHIPATACVVMSNHQSYVDIPLIYAALPAGLRLRMVAKRELFYVPVWGRAMRVSGFIPIVRSDRQRAIESLNTAKEQMARGTYIWIAPEGTRSRTGELGPLKKGGFILAQEIGVPILPVAIEGTAQVMPPSGWRLFSHQTVRVSFRPPVLTAGRKLEDVMADVERAIRPGPLLNAGPNLEPERDGQKTAFRNGSHA